MEELSPRGLEMHLIFLLPAATIHVFAPTCLHPLSCLRAASPMGQGKHHSVPPGSSLLWLVSAGPMFRPGGSDVSTVRTEVNAVQVRLQ